MKMLLHLRPRISVFIVLALCQDLASYKPIRLIPLCNEFIIEEGNLLPIRCKSNTLLKFIYPDSIGKSINTSKYHIYHKMRNGVYHHNFKRPSAVYGDTGWYSCVDHNFEISTDSYEMDWFYIYVKSDTNLFVEADTNAHLSAVVGSSIVIPCRTTSPYLKPTLIKGNEDELKKVPFDSKIGFTIRNLSLEDSNRYKCSIEKDGKEHVVNYVLSVLKESLSEPKIQVNDLFVIRGQDLKVNCTVGMNLSTEYEFVWNVPQQNNSRRTIQQFKHLDGNTIVVTSQLTVFNVTDENSGNYVCVIRSIYDKKKTTKNIIIHNRIKPITFVNEEDILYFVRKRGEDVRMVAYVETFVEPILQWFKPNGDEIVEDSKNIRIYEYYNSDGLRKLTFVKMYSILNIFSLNITNTGIYMLQAKRDYIIERINISLNVIDKPISKLTHFRSYYTFNESTEFRCEVISNPPPIIKWSFLKYSNYLPFDNSSIVHLTNVTQSADNNSSYRFESVVKMSIEMSGKIICEACNEVGCDSKTENIIVSVPPFFVATNMDETKIKTIDVIAEGYDTILILQCFAEGMPRPKVTWYKDNMLLKKNNKYLFLHHRRELHINYLMLNDSGRYSCRATNHLGIIKTYQQIIVQNVKRNIFEIILIISIFIVSFILITSAIYISNKIRGIKKMKKELMEVGLINFEEGVLECLNPNLTIDDQAELLPYDEKWEFPKERLKLREQLGKGNFGVVVKAEAIGICKNENITTVAVKMARRNTNLIYIRALVSELKIMVHLGKHLNIVNLLGACTKSISKCELLVIVEYCRFGNLHNYLLRHRNHFINQINPKTGKHDFTIGMSAPTRTVSVSNDNSLANSNIDVITHYSQETNSGYLNTSFLSDYVLSSSLSQSEWRLNYRNDNENRNSKSICTKDLLSWAFQVARGMEYLSQRKILHGDLAARNILLADDNVVKICDFGLAKSMYKNGNYKKKSKVPVPIKWMAIESIRDRIFSTQSDVWSFGIMLWEFFTLAETPYPGMEEKKQYQKLIDGYRMEQPDYSIDEIYDIMLQCWITKPMLRPSFTDLVESIGHLLEESVKMHYISLNNPYMDVNMMNLKNGKDDYLMMMSAPDHAILSLPIHKCLNSLISKDMSDSSYLYMKPECSPDSKLFISHSDDSNSEVPSPTLDFGIAIDPPMLKDEEGPYLKPISVHERRVEFVRSRQTMKD